MAGQEREQTCPNSQSAALPSSEVPSPTDGPKDCKEGRDRVPLLLRLQPN